MKKGGNQYQPDPRQALFLAYYLDPKSETFSNAYQSAIRAGYSEEYATNILSQDTDWLSENLRDSNLLAKAEKRLNQILDFEPINEEGKIDNQLLANQMKAVTLVAKGLGKTKYAERTEHTGPDGGAIAITGMKIIGDGA